MHWHSTSAITLACYMCRRMHTVHSSKKKQAAERKCCRSKLLNSCMHRVNFCRDINFKSGAHLCAICANAVFCNNFICISNVCIKVYLDDHNLVSQPVFEHGSNWGVMIHHLHRWLHAWRRDDHEGHSCLQVEKLQQCNQNFGRAGTILHATFLAILRSQHMVAIVSHAKCILAAWDCMRMPSLSMQGHLQACSFPKWSVRSGATGVSHSFLRPKQSKYKVSAK